MRVWLSKRSRGLLFAALILVLAIVGAWGVRGSLLRRAADVIPTLELERAPFDITVEATGLLRAVRSRPVSAPQVPNLWQFTIRTLAPEGTEVKAGDVVAVLDAQQLARQQLRWDAEVRTLAKEVEKREKAGEVQELELQSKLEEARVSLAKAKLKTSPSEELVSKLELKKARIDKEQAERVLELTELKAIANRASAKAELALINRKYERAKRQLEIVREGIKAMQVKAPTGGMVLHAKDWNGNKIKEGETIWRGSKIVEMPDMKEMEALILVDEVDARHVKPGQEVSISFEALPNVTFEGMIKSVSPLARRKRWNQPYRVFDTVVGFRETDEDVMRPGMRVTASIVTDRVPGVLAVPESSVEEGAGDIQVWVARGRDQGPRSVRLGSRNDGRVIVEEGLAEGDVIYIRPPNGGGGS